MNDLNISRLGLPHLYRPPDDGFDVNCEETRARALGLRAAHESPDAFSFSLRAARLLVKCKANAVLRDLLCNGRKIRRSGYDLSRGPTEICRCERPLNQANALGLAPTNHIAAEDDPRRYAFPAESCQTLRASRAGQQSDLRLWQSQLRGVRRDSDIARQSQLKTASESMALDLRNRHQRQRGEMIIYFMKSSHGRPHLVSACCAFEASGDKVEGPPRQKKPAAHCECGAPKPLNALPRSQTWLRVRRAAHHLSRSSTHAAKLAWLRGRRMPPLRIPAS